jgi:hypothetical protein
MNQIQKAKVTNIQGSGTFETQHGLFYNWDIQLENGQGGEYASKNYTTIESLPFTIGSEIEYEFDQSRPEYPKIRKPMIAGSKRWTPNSNNNSFAKSKNDPDTQLMICRQSSLQRAVEILTHNSTKIKYEDVTNLAGYLAQWVVAGTSIDQTKTIVNSRPEPIKQNNENVFEKTTDDLPF